jgi:uncharacterized small protein (TIGR04563 family)
MAGNDKRKQSLYFTDEVLEEISREANRLDRSLSWVVQRAWRIASDEVRRFPTAGQGVGSADATHRTARPRPARPETAPVENAEREPGSQVREFLAGKFENVGR